MRCFEHPNVEAVGVCGACGKGLCRDCAAESGRILACKGKCEPETRRLRDLRDFSYAQANRTHTLMQRARAISTRSALFLIVMGIGFCIWPATNHSTLKDAGVLYMMGALFLAFGLLNLLSARKQ